jgi:hypothetical protein
MMISERTQPTEKSSANPYKLFRVRRDDGGPTTVSVDPVLAIRASRALGGPANLSAFVRETASNFRRGQSAQPNRSAHVSAALREVVRQSMKKPVENKQSA